MKWRPPARPCVGEAWRSHDRLLEGRSPRQLAV